jgi:hypothetical protein
MDNFGYSICSQCEEEYVFQEGTRCARCLGVADLPVAEDTEEESSNISSEGSKAA